MLVALSFPDFLRPPEQNLLLIHILGRLVEAPPLMNLALFIRILFEG